MDNNKTTMIVLGCIGALCLCGAVGAMLSAGFYVYNNNPGDSAPAQATIAPENIPTRLPAMTPTASTGSAQPDDVPEEMPESVPERDEPAAIDDLASVAVLPFGYDDDDDGIDEGVVIDLVYYDAYDEVISFTGTPLDITMEFYAFTDFIGSTDLSKGDLIYTETVTRDHSSTLDEMFDSYIRIPYSEMQVDPNQYVRFGSVRVIVEAPNGTFEDISPLVGLYPDQ